MKNLSMLEPMDNKDRRTYITAHTTECIESMNIYIRIAERMVMCRQVTLLGNLHQYVFFVLVLAWYSFPNLLASLYCIVFALLSIYQVSAIQALALDFKDVIIIGYRALKSWEKNPSIAADVERIRGCMDNLGIPLEL